MTEEVRVTSSTGAQKGSKLARFDLIPPTPLIRLAEVFGQGSKKYEDRNWEAGYDWGLSFAALNRHLWAFWGGQDLDEHESDCPEDCVQHTNLPHLAQVAWHAMVILEFMETHPEFDTRAKKAA